jgi:hypothetical protein
MGRPGLFIAGGVGSAGTCAVDQQDTLGMLVKDDRQGPLDSWYVVLTIFNSGSYWVWSAGAWWVMPE